jgi:hypothetical protein
MLLATAFAMCSLATTPAHTSGPSDHNRRNSTPFPKPCNDAEHRIVFAYNNKIAQAHCITEECYPTDCCRFSCCPLFFHGLPVAG